MTRQALFPVLLALALAAPAESAVASEGSLLPPLPPRHLMIQVGAPVPPPRSFRSGFVVDVPGPQKLGVMTYGSAVILLVSRGRPSDSFVETGYMARGVAAPERLQATFGKFGKVSMRFRESRHRPWFGKRRDCRGADRFIKRRGVFVGNLRFRGEGGYLSVHLHRAKGAILTLAAKCEHRRRSRPASARSSSIFDFEPPSLLVANSRDGVDDTAFLALQFKGGKASYLATDEESRGKLAIVRVALVRRRGHLHVNEALTAARVSPPAPFHGSGQYTAAPDGTTSWGGDLSANFPGAPRTPLTGPQFDAFLEAPF
jgi:hypothetical protein